MTVEQARAAARRHFELISQGRDQREVEQAEQAAREAETLRQINFADVLEAWTLIRAVKFRRRVRVVRESRAMLNPPCYRKRLCLALRGSVSPSAAKSCVLHPTHNTG